MNTASTLSSKKSQTIRVALVGNPNVGKSVIFNYLTGIYVDVSNYPGTTIEISRAKLLNIPDDNYYIEIIDTPGVYGVSNSNDEERATQQYVMSADLIINVVSALSLGRDLFLSRQLADMGKPMILVINQSDEAINRKLEIDTKTLSKELGVDVISTVATKKLDLDKIYSAILSSYYPSKDNILSFRTGTPSQAINQTLKRFEGEALTRSEAVLMAENDSQLREEIYRNRRNEVNELTDKVVSKLSFSKRDFLGRLLLNPIIGSISAALILYLFLYLFLGNFIAGTVVDFLEKNLFNTYYEPVVRELVSKILPINSNDVIATNLLFSDIKTALGTIIAGNFGLLTLTITYLYGLLFPLVFGFYLGLALLEDSGYLPRLAVLADGILSRLGMNGRAIIPLILGGGCVTMATVTTRLLKNDKEKLITMTLLGLTIPCSAQLGVIQGLLMKVGGITPWLIWTLTLVIIFSITGTVMNKLIPGKCGDFVSDIPPMRLPSLQNLWKKTYSRTKVFMDEATPAFFLAALFVSVLQVSGSLGYIINLAKPMISGALLLPAEVTLSFILGMIRRDFGAFGLLSIPMTAAQTITACVVLTLFVPCIATVAVMIKEKNLATAMTIWISSWVLAITVGGVLARLLIILN